MAGALVGGAVLSATLQVLFDRIASRPVVDFILGRKLSDAPLKKLKLRLLAVYAVLDDAEEKQITKPAVKAWLDELKDAVYDAEDLLDEIATEALRCKMEAEFRTSTDQVHNFVPSTSLNPFDEGFSLKTEEILGRLEYIAEQKDVLGLTKVVGGKPFKRLPTTSLVEESNVYARGNDKEEIIKWLLSDDTSENKIGVISIVGMGGLGKTTLAQLVYNDAEVTKQFEFKAWVCVSEEFDVLRVTKTIYQAVISSPCDMTDLNDIQVKLKERLNGKKFLLILDDVWNKNYMDWDVLRRPLLSGAKGSKIIVTTRNENVASIMDSAHTHRLKKLLDEDCWLLFANHAFGNGNSSAHPKLETIGREIIKKCKGLPLAAKALGGLLCSSLDVKYWSKILKSDIWDLPDDKCNILPALRLSYHYLPPHLKRCFAYCSIFPKDYEFEKEQLVLLWMAEDFLQCPNKNEKPEDVGDEYFNDMLSMSFFQRSGGNKSCFMHRSGGNKSCFIMHDLVNDLAKFVSGEFCFRLEGDNSHQIPEKTRHSSYLKTSIDKAFDNAKCVRTLLSLNLQNRYFWTCISCEVLNHLLSIQSCLRVLSFSYHNNIRELPESIVNLKHLRYLDLSFTEISRLPDSVSTLFNLQTLLLLGCNSLVELPTNLARLTNLRHLRITNTFGNSKLKEMPRHMGRLRSLQTLSIFIVGKQNGSTITELREFQHLRGALHIQGLQNVVHAGDAIEANLKDKECLDELVLEWSSTTEDSENERDVLDKLQPHANLRELTIKHYGGTRFPGWLGDHSFCNMVYLRLENCKYCFSLPPLGQLPCLKELYITGLGVVERIGPEFYGSGSFTIKPFGSLEILRFEKMPELVEWLCSGDEGGEFPCLREVYIQECPKLTGVACLEKTCLHQLEISNCPSLKSFPKDGRLLTTLKTLRIGKCRELELLPPEETTQNSYASLEDLSVESSCDSLKSFPLGLFPKLQEVEILDCVNLEFLRMPEGLQEVVTSLRHLEIILCPKIVSFPDGGLPTPNLTSFHVSICKNLKSLPDRMHALLPSLQDLCIDGCPEVESFPQGGLPSNLKYLAIHNCNKLTARRMEWGLQTLASLEIFEIQGCEEVESFPEEWLLPSTLTSLQIYNLPNLRHLDKRGFQKLTSLQELGIDSCPELQTLPEEGLPTSLSSLEIWDCPLLRQRYQREIGEDWPKIAHIPNVSIACRISSVCLQPKQGLQG